MPLRLTIIVVTAFAGTWVVVQVPSLLGNVIVVSLESDGSHCHDGGYGCLCSLSYRNLNQKAAGCESIAHTIEATHGHALIVPLGFMGSGGIRMREGSAPSGHPTVTTAAEPVNVGLGSWCWFRVQGQESRNPPHQGKLHP